MLFVKINHFRHIRLGTVSIKFAVLSKLIFRLSVFIAILLDSQLYLFTTCFVFLSDCCDFVALVLKLLLLLIDDFHRSFHVIEFFFKNIKFLITIKFDSLTSLHLNKQGLSCFIIFLAIKIQFFNICNILLNIFSYSGEILFNLFEIIVRGTKSCSKSCKSAFELINFFSGFFKLVFKIFV